MGTDIHPQVWPLVLGATKIFILLILCMRIHVKRMIQKSREVSVYRYGLYYDNNSIYTLFIINIIDYI